jgi:outer membrane protein assembly factor BamD (BamD/ComL family)
LLALYPTSPLKDGADQQVAHLQEWFAEKDYLNGNHYYHKRAYDSAIIYLKDVVKNYPNVPITRVAYLRLVDAYRKIHYKEDADDVCNTLRVTYPGDLQVQRSCGMTHTATAQHP